MKVRYFIGRVKEIMTMEGNKSLARLCSLIQPFVLRLCKAHSVLLSELKGGRDTKCEDRGKKRANWVESCFLDSLGASMRGIVVPMIMWRIEVHRTPTLE